MKIVIFIMLVSLAHVSAEVKSQNSLINLKLKNVSIEKAVIELEKQLKQDFFFSKQEIDVNKKITINLTQATLEEAVRIVFGKQFKYRIVDNVIVISPLKNIPDEIKKMVIKGKVLDKDSVAIPGVTIRLKGSAIGVATDREGKFSFSIPETKDPVLIFSFIGMKPQEIKYTKEEFLTVILVEETTSLNDVVVTGYANIKKESFTGASTKVNKEDLLKVSSQNVMKALQVFDPSFKLIQNNAMGSDPNTMPEYYIRGRSGTSELKELDKLTADDVSQFALTNNPSAPIFILDGFEVDMAKVYDMDINRIESVTILKDAAATAVYGSRAANGVIVIETSAPEPGEIRISYAGTLAVSAPDLSSYHLLNAVEALEAEYQAGLYTGTNANSIAAGIINYDNQYNNILRGIDTDWISKPLQTEVNHKHFLYIDGGSQELRWGLELNYQHNGGVMKKSFRDVYGAAITVDYRWKSLQIKNQASLSIMSSEDSPYGSFSDYVRMKPYLSPYDPETGNPYKKFEIYRTSVPPNGATRINNPLYEASLQSFDKTKYKEFTDNLSISWYINNYWLLKGTFSASFKLQDEDEYKDPASGDFYQSENDLKGKYTDREIRTSKWNANGLLSYNQQLGKHNLNFSLGLEASETKQEATYAYYQGFPFGSVPSPSSAVDVSSKPTYKDSYSRRFGTYLQFNYSFNDIYLFDVSGRLDGSSAFGSKKKTGTFWSFGTGINIHNYAFMKNISFLNQFKIRATYGQTGKANFNPYQARTTYEVLYDVDYANIRGMKLKALGNENLKWEKVRTWNAGTEISVLNNALTLKVDYYHAKTLDQVEDVSIPSSSGFTSYKSNVGEILNEGVDIDINIRAFENRDWSIYLFGNANHNKNTITKIGKALENYNKRIDEHFSSYGSTSTSSNVATPFMKYEVGNSLSAIYGMKSLGIDPARGDELYVKRDGTTTHVWKSEEQQNLGDSDPKISGSFGLNVRWKNFTLYTTFMYRWGGQAYNQTLQAIENVDLKSYSGDRRILTDRWKEIGDVTPLKDIKDQTYVTRPTSRFVQDDNTLTFNSLTVGYDFNKALVNRWGLSTLRLQFNMEDIATISSIKQERGTSYPFARSFNFSMNVSF
ncbi:SusC/RagA family TonB-linked outer membrane protein [Sanguibacteroides justesenii]|uniref:Uncharacterized protein n=3 Tax=Porphyromonadaceae TaxID=171551 RepID=A0A0C3REP5_9PORP|nr:hypothetical protein BA92_08450 [Sanguibacteroides justesenii]PXZ42816.1 SusC/RagA family TonB-linked outer membrane protein [Sanguibacteroides justesenii]